MVRRKQRWDGPACPEPDGPGARVVVECADGAEGWIVARALERAGHAVATCTGPDRHVGPCPLVDGRGCPAAEGAEVVVNLLGIGSTGVQEVMARVHEVNPGAAFVVRVAPADAPRVSSLVAGCPSTLVPPHTSTDAIVDAVSSALAARRP